MILNVDGESNSIPPNHLAEILTGQGKSWALALLAGYFSLNGYQVTVACYSDYLSQRDEKDFRKNLDAFQFENKVEYKTFEAMCTDLSSLKNKVDKQSDQSILLVDEVDIFVSEYFGETFGVIATVKNINIETIQKEIWQQIIEKSNRDETKLFDFINDKFSREINGDRILSRLKESNVLKSHIEKMIRTAIRIREDMTKENLLKDRYQIFDEYIRLKKADGKYDKNWLVEYETSFYYLKLIYEKENSFDNAKSYRHNFGYLYISYGLISYSEIPNSFIGIFGVSGTLRDLSNGEQSLLEYYNIKRKSYYPSFFGHSKLKFDTSKDFHIKESKTDWFYGIVTSAKKQIAESRSVLIFFDNEALLDDFYKSHSGDLGVIRYYVTPNEIFDGKEKKVYNDSDFNRLITDQYAGHHGKVTLLTKHFGRGVDFQSETSVNEKGGIHVIQTFFSSDIKEEIQIKGRTGENVRE
ncbi:unnamed protein product [Rotaria sordida]|uniref:SecA DEAD-like N-terminal domain-containing protein n=1 Tax=Rotaria sordida TaxID=392033 RepID=A0A815T3M0_9BILA|nr:unnamed protein product [Rotaria sordida]